MYNWLCFYKCTQKFIFHISHQSVLIGKKNKKTTQLNKKTTAHLEPSISIWQKSVQDNANLIYH